MVSLFYLKNNELTFGNQWSFFHLIHRDLVWEYLRPKSRTWSHISSTSRWVLFKMLRGEFWITFSSPACNGGGLYWNKFLSRSESFGLIEWICQEESFRGTSGEDRSPHLDPGICKSMQWSSHDYHRGE